MVFRCRYSEAGRDGRKKENRKAKVYFAKG